jgi:ubiquitin C-terminal hydrolase
VEGYKCDRCARRGDCEKRMRVAVWPKVLVIMLKRFKGTGRRKIDERVDYKRNDMQLGE